MINAETEIQILIEPMCLIHSVSRGRIREINKFKKNFQNSLSKTTNLCWNYQKSKVRGISLNPLIVNIKKK